MLFCWGWVLMGNNLPALHKCFPGRTLVWLGFWWFQGTHHVSAFAKKQTYLDLMGIRLGCHIHVPGHSLVYSMLKQ
jgi:hypothetical protein